MKKNCCISIHNSSGRLRHLLANRDVNEARTLEAEAEARTLEAEAEAEAKTLEAEAEAKSARPRPRPRPSQRVQS